MALKTRARFGASILPQLLVPQQLLLKRFEAARTEQTQRPNAAAGSDEIKTATAVDQNAASRSRSVRSVPPRW
jgi:hypothetical protein